MPTLGVNSEVVDAATLDTTVSRFRDAQIRLPTFAELADPSRIPSDVRERLASVDSAEPHPLNLFRVHWHNDLGGGYAPVPDHLVLPSELTGVAAPIVLLMGDTFPMIDAHKVLAAYGCLAPRIVTGEFDPTRHKAVWPSTGNYCRGGVAISRIMGCRGVAVLPEGMSRERFRWLEEWVAEPEDILRTPGTESNVKEIYDKCAELEAEPDNIIFNQFSEFGNYLVHRECTGPAIGRVVEHLREGRPALGVAAFVSATGSAGTLAAGDHLKHAYGARIVAVEALECPTMLANGFGEHNIQGIGDKHIPLIHNVMNTDFVAAVSDRATDALGVLFNSPEGHEYLVARRGVPTEAIESLDRLGLSSICNVLAAIKTARYLDLGEDQAIVTVATDGAAMYPSERAKTLARDFPHGMDSVAAAEAGGRYLLGATTDHFRELTHEERTRIFNLGYFTWVEQQGISIEDFEARREPRFWEGLRDLVPRWDAGIEELNRRVAEAAK